jgi:hypothetical protein
LTRTILEPVRRLPAIQGYFTADRVPLRGASMRARGAGAEGRPAMGMGDRLINNNDLEDKRTFLRRLIDDGQLEKAALGITKQVIDRGDDSLSQNQKDVFKRDVLDVFVTAECKCCCGKVRWFEIYQAYRNGGYCEDCAYTFDK